LVDAVGGAFNAAGVTVNVTLGEDGVLDVRSATPGPRGSLALTLQDATGNHGSFPFPTLGSPKTKEDIQSVTLTGARAGRGGGIYLQQATVNLFDSPVTSNTATVQGGAYFNDRGKITFTNSPLAGNSGVTDQSLLSNVTSLLRTYADDLTAGVQGYFDNFSGTLEDAFRKVDIPVIGDQLVDGLKPLFDSLASFRTDLHDFLQDVLALADTPGGPTLPELFQNAVYLALGPGAAGLDQLTPAVR